MTQSEEEIKRLFRVRRTLMQMLRDRGYSVADSEIALTIEQFVTMFGATGSVIREKLCFLKTHLKDSSDQIHVFFPDAAGVSVEQVRAYYSKQMKSGIVYRATLVVQQNLTSVAQTKISKLSSMFQLEESELMMNITEHVLVPKHQVLTFKEKKTLLEAFNVDKTKLPRIQVTDPVARYYGLKRGLVVKIIRPSKTAGKSDYFRYYI